MSGNICRICHKTVCDNFQIIEALDNTSYKLLLKLNLDINKDSVMCNECLEKLLVPLHLISTCVYTKNNIKNGVNLDSEEFDSINNVNAVVETGDQWKCFFCIKITERDGLISLNDSKENMFLLDILKKHFPELNLSNSEVHLTCETCLDSLLGLLSFMRNRLNVEEKIRTYTEIEETDSKSQVELCNAQEFTLKPILKFESEYCNINDKSECYNEIREKFTIKEETEIKTEEIINQEIHINHEENDIKLDQSNYETFQEKSTSLTVNDGKIYAHQCSICSFNTDCAIYLEKHILIHKTAVPKKYKCEICIYSTNSNGHLHRHMLMHRNSSEMVTHKDPSEVLMYRCGMCSFEAKYKTCLTHHKLVHRSVTMHKCTICSFETKYKGSLKKHMLIHKDPSEVTMYKCEMCSYESKRRSSFKKHVLTHKLPSEMDMY